MGWTETKPEGRAERAGEAASQGEGFGLCLRRREPLQDLELAVKRGVLPFVKIPLCLLYGDTTGEGRGDG